MAEAKPVDGKESLGTRRLVVSHVENAASFYAYQEAEAAFMKEVLETCRQHCTSQPGLKEAPKEQQVVAMYSDTDEEWYRGIIEVLDQGPDKKQVKVRSLDFGWIRLFQADSLRQLPEAVAVADLPVRCEKYKLAGLKPKGRANGYSPADRHAGAEWLRDVIGNQIVVAVCQKQVPAGILADCTVGGTDLKKAALRQGHVFSLSGPPPYPARPFPFGRFGGRFPGGFPPGAAMFPMGPPNGVNADFDYASYNGKGTPSGSGGRGGRPSGSNMRPTGNSSGGPTSEEVKRLEKIISEDKKTITQLKKTASLDANIKELFDLLDKAALAREKGRTAAIRPLTILSDPAQLIEEIAGVSCNLMAGIERVEAASRRIKELNKGEDQSQISQGRADLQRHIRQYLEEVKTARWEEELQRVNSRITALTPHIPNNLKLLTGQINCQEVTQAHLLEVVSIVKGWRDQAGASASADPSLPVKSKQEVENLAQNLIQVAESLRAKSHADSSGGPPVPAGLDAGLAAVRTALQAELAGTKQAPGAAAAAKKEGPHSETGMKRGIWRALLALQAQLELAGKKRAEYDAWLIGASGDF